MPRKDCGEVDYILQALRYIFFSLFRDKTGNKLEKFDIKVGNVLTLL